MNEFILEGAPGWSGAQTWRKGGLWWSLSHPLGLKAECDFGAGVFAVWRPADGKTLARERVAKLSIRDFARVLNNVLRDEKALLYGLGY